MWRLSAIVLTAYNYGNPNLEVLRPTVFDRPLANFHEDMDTVLAQGIQQIERYADRTLQFISAGTEQAGTKLKTVFRSENKN